MTDTLLDRFLMKFVIWKFVFTMLSFPDNIFKRFWDCTQLKIWRKRLIIIIFLKYVIYYVATFYYCVYRWILKKLEKYPFFKIGLPGWASLYPKICIKYRKHWKSYVSFHLFGQIGHVGLNWAVRNYSPNWHQISHETPMTIFKCNYNSKATRQGIICECWF